MRKLKNPDNVLWRASLAAAALMSMMAHNAYGQDRCSDILQSGLFDQSVRQSDQRYANAERYWACNASLSEARDYLKKQSSSSDNAGGSVSYGIFSAEGGGGKQDANSLTEEKLRSWKQDNCSETSSDQNKTAFEYFAQSSVSAGVVSAWKECMQQKESFSCWASPQGNNTIFTYNWRSSDVDLPVIRSAEVIVDGEKYTLADPGTEVYIGSKSYSITGTSGKNTTVIVDILHENRYTHSCSAYVPVPRKVAAAAVTAPRPAPRPVQKSCGATLTNIRSAPGGLLFALRQLQERGNFNRNSVESLVSNFPPGAGSPASQGFHLRTVQDTINYLEGRISQSQSSQSYTSSARIAISELSCLLN